MKTNALLTGHIAAACSRAFCWQTISGAAEFHLTLIFYIPGAIHAVLVVKDAKADKRAKKYGSQYE